MTKLKVLLIIVFLGISFSVKAQETTAPVVNKTKTNHFERGSEIAISYGFYTLEEMTFSLNYGLFKMMESITNLVCLFDPNADVSGVGVVGSPKFQGAVNLTYSYRLEKWFELSGTLNYSSFDMEYFNLEDNTFLYSKLYSIINVIPEARFTWFRNRNVTLYSSVGLGVNMWFSAELNKPMFAFAGKLIPIGIKAGGKHFYGFTELGWASTGTITLGVGYKF